MPQNKQVSQNFKGESAVASLFLGLIDLYPEGYTTNKALEIIL